MGWKGQKLGRGLQALDMGTLQLWGSLGVGEVGTTVGWNAPSLRSGMKIGWQEVFGLCCHLLIFGGPPS